MKRENSAILHQKVNSDRVENKIRRPSSAYSSRNSQSLSLRLQNLLAQNQILNCKIEIANKNLSSLKLFKNGASRIDKAKDYTHYNKLGTRHQQLTQKTQTIKIKVQKFDIQIESLQSQFQAGVSQLQKAKQAGEKQKKRLKTLEEQQKELVDQISLLKKQEQIVVDFLSHQYQHNPENVYKKQSAQKQQKKISKLANYTLLMYREWREAMKDQLLQRAKILQKRERVKQNLQSKIKLLEEKISLKKEIIEPLLLDK